MLNSPELVGTDHNGTLYIFDNGNSYIRIVDPSTRIMRTLIHGSCHIDYLTNRPQLRVPFQLELKPMVCFKGWIKVEGQPYGHNVRLPNKPDILDPSYIFDGYKNPNEQSAKKAVIERLTIEELAEKDISTLTDEQM